MGSKVKAHSSLVHLCTEACKKVQAKRNFNIHYSKHSQEDPRAGEVGVFSRTHWVQGTVRIHPCHTEYPLRDMRSKDKISEKLNSTKSTGFGVRETGCEFYFCY